MTIDRDAPLRFLRTAFHPDDWVAVLLNCHDTGGTAQRVEPLSLIASPPFQAGSEKVGVSLSSSRWCGREGAYTASVLMLT